MRLTLQTAPASEPVTRDEAKTHCRVIGTADDSYVDSLITAARLYVERRTGRAFPRLRSDLVRPERALNAATGLPRT